jgi:serine/threonine protein kinase
MHPRQIRESSRSGNDTGPDDRMPGSAWRAEASPGCESGPPPSDLTHPDEVEASRTIEDSGMMAGGPLADRAAADAAAGYGSAELADPDEFMRSLLETGIIGQEELDGEALRVPTTEGVLGLSRALEASGRLTAYQAAVLRQSKSHALVIGNYLILDKLGAGGMGTVFKARHRRSGRVVALKVLSATFARDRTAVRRFKREVEAAGRLTHPNVVTALDADQDRGADFLVMEYVDGHDLNRLVRQRGPLSVGQAIDFLIQAARGLEAAHAAGIIHRDIKPSNLILDLRGVVRVLDLGLARIVDASLPLGHADSGRARLTESGTYLGTVDFMAPEQAEDARRADHLADVYSLGCTLFFLLCGREPFAAETLLKRILVHQEKPAPSLNSVGVDVPLALEQVYQRMMAKRPLDRPVSMSEVIALLEAVKLAGESPARLAPQQPSEPMHRIEAQSTTPAGRPLSGRRRRAKILGLCSTGLLGAAAAGFAVFKGSIGQTGVQSAPIRSTAKSSPADKAPLDMNAWLALKNQAIHAKLDQETRMDFPDGIALNDLLKYVRQSTSPPFPGIPIYVDPIGLQEEEKTMRSTVTIDAYQIHLKTALAKVLGQLGLSYTDHGGVLIVSSNASIDEELRKQALPPADDSPKTKLVLEKLYEPIDMSFREGTPLNDVLLYIKQATKTPHFAGVSFVVDPVGLKQVERSPGSKVQIDVEGVPLLTTLRLVLEQLGLAYAVKDGQLIISSQGRVDDLR